MKNIIIFVIIIIFVSCNIETKSSNDKEMSFTKDSISTTNSQYLEKNDRYIEKYKNIKEALDACNVDSFVVKYYPININVTPNDCYITPSIGEETLEINPFPFVEYLVENQNSAPPFVIQKDTGHYKFHGVDGYDVCIYAYIDNKIHTQLIVYSDTVNNYVQTFSSDFEKFYKLLQTYKTNYFIQKKYYEEHHKFIED